MAAGEKAAEGAGMNPVATLVEGLVAWGVPHEVGADGTVRWTALDGKLATACGRGGAVTLRWGELAVEAGPMVALAMTVGAGDDADA